MDQKIIAGFAAFSLLFGCIGGEEPSDVMPPSDQGIVASPQKSGEAKELCFKWPYDTQPPIFVKDAGIVITRVLKQCSTLGGDAGFAKDASWMAMGFPCSVGGGSVQIFGHHYKPHMLSFHISNSCPMKPASSKEVNEIKVASLGFTPDANLLSYNPFALQYWELVEFGESDTGFAVEVRNEASVSTIWQRFRAGTPIPIRLFGRENTWVKGENRIYQVDAEILKTTYSQFSLKVNAAKALSELEVQEVRTRCESLGEGRECDQIFSQ